MKKILAIVCILIASSAHAQSAKRLMGVGISPEAANQFVTEFSSAAQTAVAVTGSFTVPTVIATGISAGAASFSGNITTTGGSLLVPFSIVTPATTPTLASNFESAGINIIPTFAANGASFLPTPIAGQELQMVNNGANAHVLFPGAGVSMTTLIKGTVAAGGAATIASVPGYSTMTCYGSSATQWYCADA